MLTALLTAGDSDVLRLPETRKGLNSGLTQLARRDQAGKNAAPPFSTSRKHWRMNLRSASDSSNAAQPHAKDGDWNEGEVCIEHTVGYHPRPGDLLGHLIRVLV